MRTYLFILTLIVIQQDVMAQLSMSENRIPQQIVGGVLVGLGGAALGGVTGRILAGQDDTGWEALGAVLAGAFIGYTAGNGYGVYRFGNTASKKGSLGFTLLGSASGLVGGVMIGANMGEALLPVVATSVTLGSMLGYNMTRKSVIAFLQPATSTPSDHMSIRTPLDVPESSVALIRIQF